MVFTSDDVFTAWVNGSDIPEAVLTPVIVKNLGFIVEYAGTGILTPNATMGDIVSSVTYGSTVTRQQSGDLLPSSPSRTITQAFHKKAVPTLTKFTGHDEDYFTWRKSTINVIDTAEFGLFLDETGINIRYPSVSESVFYALSGAIHGGQAQSIAQCMLDNKTLDPVLLWTNLEDYYNAALNRANVVLFDICKLLNLLLTSSALATTCISDHRNCLQRLRKNNAKLVEDANTLQALLLVAIQDDDFEMVRDSIVHKPECIVDNILTEIRGQEISMMMKDLETGNGSGTGTRKSRCIQFSPTAKSNDRHRQILAMLVGRTALNQLGIFRGFRILGEHHLILLCSNSLWIGGPVETTDQHRSNWTLRLQLRLKSILLVTVRNEKGFQLLVVLQLRTHQPKFLMHQNHCSRTLVTPNENFELENYSEDRTQCNHDRSFCRTK